ncbi:Pollen receptor-like kinase 3 [Stylosanthes scabra]|uniref:Pollen receptor-like kinase 3 n=1 Tax=Stylosanthes scabra TaxID=79078 RepID=A0ABU6ZLG0_9FABA|nr:Pollen receptor-like kinase 3 [Stylosanthes scabra]
MAAVRSNNHNHNRHVICMSLIISVSLYNLPVSLSGDTDALLKLKQSLTNADRVLDTWVPNALPCSWLGVVCFNGMVTGLRLSDMGLSGTIDIDALVEIPGLRTLSFTNNTFTGPIPDFSRLGAIKALLLSYNQFSGIIPSDFFTKLASLKKIWIDSNSFSGPIPESLMELELLKELHIENNHFSGRIPTVKEDLLSFDASNNNLEGPIPESLAKFGENAFSGSGNEKLCGKPLKRACDGNILPSFSPDKNQGSGSGSGSGWGFRMILFLFLAVVVAFLFVFMKSRRKSDDNEFGLMGRINSTDSMVDIHVASSNGYRAPESEGAAAAGMAKRGVGGGGESNRGARTKGGGMTDLVMVNDERGVFGLQDLMKASAEVLGNGGLGSAYKAAMTNGLSVVVKRMRDMNKMGRDVFDAEMKQFGRMRHKNILGPLAYHYRREEKLFVTEYMPKGSLLYVLHGDRGTAHSELNWPTRLKIVKGIARGLSYLYTQFSTYDLPHGNLKSTNVLLSDDYEPLLGDFGFHPLINPTAAGQAMFAYKSPDYIQYQKVSQKTDVYCLGVIILEIITGKFPSQYHSNGKGGTDVVQRVVTAISESREAEVIDPELQGNMGSQSQMLQLIHIGADCTESNPDQRLSMKEAVRRIEEVQV